MNDTKEQRQYYECIKEEYRKLIADLKAEREVERLKNEVKRSRSCLSDSVENERTIDYEFRELQTENAKLRELAQYAYECAIHSDHATCDDCRRMNGHCLVADRMRELKVEV